LKPANIIVRAGDDPMILDFGTATAQDVSRVTRPGTAVGSMRFIAPEVFTGVAPSLRTDIYSLGVVAYVALAGKLPYNAASGAVEMLEMIRNQPPQRIELIQPDVPPRLSDVVARAMEKNPDNRFASALAFDEALAEITIEATKVLPRTGDYARWAPASVIHNAVTQNAGTQNAGTQNAVQPPASAAHSLGDASAESSTSQPRPVTGLHEPEAGLEEARTDQSPRPVSLTTSTATGNTDPNGVPAPLDTLDNQASATALADAALASELDEPPTVRVASLASLEQRAPDLDVDEGVASSAEKTTLSLMPLLSEESDRRAVRRGPDRRALAIAALGAVGVAGIVFVVVSLSGPDPNAPTHASVDAGTAAALAVDAGNTAAAALVTPPTAVDAGEMAFAEPLDFDDAGPDKPVDPGHPRSAGVRADPKIEDGIRQVRASMKQKGLLVADVPAAVAALEKAHAQNAHGNRKDADKQLALAKGVVDGQAVDRAFVMGKLGRFDKAYGAAKQRRPELAGKVEPSARKAAASFGAGQYDAANQTLNTAFQLVAKAK
ncbi:MAG TPA: protein kinase, partial [Myxococcota bacterium]